MTGVNVPRGGWVRRHRVVVGSVVTLVLVAVACAGWWHLYPADTRADREEARQLLVDYLGRVQSSDYRGTYLMLCRDTRYDYSESEHVQFLQEQPPFTAYRIVGEPFMRSNFHEGMQLVYKVEFKYTDGATATTEFVVQLLADGAEICDSPYDRMP